MRVLFLSRPFFGHVLPMVPLASALRDNGHSVAFLSAEAFLPEIERLGWQAVAAGVDPRLPPPGPPNELPGYSEEVLAGKVEDVLADGRRSGVDAIVREPTDFAGVFAAELLGVPQVTLGRSLFLPPAHWAGLIGPALERVRRRFSLPADARLDRIFGACYLDTVPAWFEPPDVLLPDHRVEIRAEIFDGLPYAEAEWHTARSDGIYVTFGTVYNRNRAVMRETLEAVAQVGRDVLLTVGPGGDPEACSVGRDHVTVAPFLRQSSALGRCALVVCHGGYSTVMGALSDGIPLVVLPQGSDHEANARQCERLGAAVMVRPEQFSGDAVRRAVEQVLEDPSYTVAARALSARIAAAPPVEFGARLIEQLTTSHRVGIDAASRPVVSG